MPFWLVTILDELVCIIEVDFGIVFSNQIRSRRLRDVLKLRLREFVGSVR